MAKRNIDAVFSFRHQCYLNHKGSRLKTQPNWDHPCPVCRGPAHNDYCNAYYEHHICLNCGKEFNVN